jgi:hypothetical protein
LLTVGGLLAAQAAGDPPKEEGRPTTGPSEERAGPSGSLVLRQYPWEDAGDFEVRRRLCRIVPHIEMKATELSEALKRVGTLCEVSISTHWAALELAGVEKDTEVTLSLTNVRGDDLLEAVLHEAGGWEVELAYEVSHRIVQVSTREDLGRTGFTVTYECADLLQVPEEELEQLAERIAKALAKTGNNTLVHDPDVMSRLVRDLIRESRDAARHDLMRTVEASIDPESWREQGGNVGYLTFVGTQMVVTQTKTAHMRLYDLLENLLANLKKPTDAARPSTDRRQAYPPSPLKSD